MADTAYVILAAGRGSRMGRIGNELHKSLLPISQKAILTHLVELAPPGSDLIVCVGYRSAQLHDFMALAHPEINVTWVDVMGWDAPGGGPGASLLAARDAVGDRRMVFTSCDTLWEPDPVIWETSGSWAAYAPLPPGSPPERWCRLGIDDLGDVWVTADKQPVALTQASQVYTGLASIAALDLPKFWDGLAKYAEISGEKQVSGGFNVLLGTTGGLRGQRIKWTDTGDMMAYRKAIMLRDGYDWSKSSEVTWVFPHLNRVVKWNADPRVTERSAARRDWLASALTGGNSGIPRIYDRRDGMTALEYIHGVNGYDAVKTEHDLAGLMLSRAVRAVMEPVVVNDDEAAAECAEFYGLKTMKRINMLREPLRTTALDVYHTFTISDWASIINNCRPVKFHGDFNLGNIIFDGREWHLIDWRDTFCAPESGQLWGDWRYDAAKFLAGLRVHWGWARRGDFTPWELGKRLYPYARDIFCTAPMIEEIGVLSLLSSAPLHEAPLDEVLVARAAEWMSELR